MTAEALAALVRARRVGRDRWQARCPAHRDRLPSLSITEGRDGRTLVRCHAGCETRAVLAALGLTMRTLFAGEQPTDRAAVAEARRTRSEHATAEREQARRYSLLADRERRLSFAVSFLGARLMRSPQDDAAAELFGAALDLLRIAEAGFAPVSGTDGKPLPYGDGKPYRAPPAAHAVTPAWSPFGEVPDERTEAARVRTMAELLRFAATGKAEPTQPKEQKARANGPSEEFTEWDCLTLTIKQEPNARKTNR